MVAATLMLWSCVVAIGLAYSLGVDGQISKRAELVSRYALPFVIASWVVADARKRGLQLWYDYDSFVFFAYPVVVPIYLFQTRGPRAFLTLLCFAGICLSAAVPILVVSIIREFVA